MNGKDIETTTAALVALAGLIFAIILAASFINGDWGWLDETPSGQDGYCMAHPNNPICD